MDIFFMLIAHLFYFFLLVVPLFLKWNLVFFFCLEKIALAISKLSFATVPWSTKIIKMHKAATHNNFS